MSQEQEPKLDHDTVLYVMDKIIEKANLHFIELQELKWEYDKVKDMAYRDCIRVCTDILEHKKLLK